MRTLSSRFYRILAIVFGWSLLPFGGLLGAVEPVVFNRDIRPILSDTCFRCHGPDKAKRKADLRLDVREAAIKSKAIVPGKPEESPLITRIHSTDAKELMPPPAANKTLTSAQKDLLRRWVAEGASYQGHWAYEKPARPSGDSISIDAIVGKHLAAQRLQAAPEADRRTLIRRLSFDLTGLPPTPEEVAQFINDQSPQAYEMLVDRLLASPQYGERMAIGWLDVVRFADTIGYHSDNPRNVWPYRDYVIKSFNDNKPFDQFTIEQLAGDLLPNPTTEQRVASCFNHLLLTTEEGGAQSKDYEARMLGDRVRAVGTVWLAQTIGCCQCHDHKFDPIPQKEFYSMGAFFADISEPIIGRRDNGLAIPSADQKAKLETLQKELKESEDKAKVLNAQQAETTKKLEAVRKAQADQTKNLTPTPTAEQKAEIDRLKKNVQDLESHLKAVATAQAEATKKLATAKKTLTERTKALPQTATAQQKAEVERLKQDVKTLEDKQKTQGNEQGETSKKLDAARKLLAEGSKSQPLMTTPEQKAELDRLDQEIKELDALLKSRATAVTDANKKVEASRNAFNALQGSVPHCMVTAAQPNPRTVRVLPRGNWLDETGPIVQPTFPEFLKGPKSDGKQRFNRLDLARWLVSSDNPLTARVFVNRLWKQFFGIGLSRTLDDLGSQGEWPLYPDLLDYLACEFRDSQWDVKKIIRVIVTSKTYRQSSLASKELLTRDPENRLLARQSRFRIDAELVRDNALAVSGLLNRKMGGPSVKPYQPEGYWENLNFPTRDYQADHNEDQYRRGLYTWWQRSFFHPSLMAFDAPSREECTAERSRSNIPQQALVLLNDPTYVETARALAARIVQQGGATPVDRIKWVWQQVLQRDPSPEESQRITQLVEKHLKEFVANPKSAESLLKVGFQPMPPNMNPAELAAWTSVARVLLNLHESITRN